jgi:hypothetical protein
MNNMDLYNAIGNIDIRYIAEAYENKIQNRRILRIAAWNKRVLVLAGCILMVIVVNLGYDVMPSEHRQINVPSSNKVIEDEAVYHTKSATATVDTTGSDNAKLGTTGSETEAADITKSETTLSVTIDNIHGLPTDDFTWRLENTGEAADRLGATELRNMLRDFYHDDTDDVEATFTIVSVDSVTPTKKGQIATCTLPSERLLLGDEIAQPFQVEQALYGGCTHDEENNLLRQGGVYVLSLVRDPYVDSWVAIGDLDVLFEVDDQGLIHSHSVFPAMNKYDGVKTEILFQDITYLYHHPILTSRFADYISRGCKVDTAGSTIGLIGTTNGEWSVDSVEKWNAEGALDYTAHINASGVIIPANGANNVFEPLSGMTVEEMNAAIREIGEYTLEGKHQYMP